MSALEIPPYYMKTRTAAWSAPFPSSSVGVSPFYQNFSVGRRCPSARQRERPSSFIRARTSSLGATRRGTFLRTKRVMSVSMPSFIRAYLAYCLYVRPRRASSFSSYDNTSILYARSSSLAWRAVSSRVKTYQMVTSSLRAIAVIALCSPRRLAS